MLNKSICIMYKTLKIDAGKTFQEVYYTLIGLKVPDKKARELAAEAVLEHQTEIVLKGNSKGERKQRIQESEEWKFCKEAVEFLNIF